MFPAEITAKAVQVLGSSDEAHYWLSAPAIGLNGQRPADMMDTSENIELVYTLLVQMEYGVFP